MKSMTGFVHAEEDNKLISASLEIKSINSRYKDITVRLPQNLISLENRIREMLNKAVKRGKIEVVLNLTFNNTDQSNIIVNEKLAHNLSQAINRLLKLNTFIDPSIDLSVFTNFPGILSLEEETPDLDEIWEMLEPLINRSIEALLSARQIEGDHLEKDIIGHKNNAVEIIQEIKELAPESIASSQNRLRERLELYLQDVELDEVRFLNEVAVLANKLAIDEEISRLESHMKRFDEILREDDAIGRKLDFLIQELNRETNTIGSKTDSIEISNRVVDLKSEIEKMREQVQNVE